MIFYLLFCDLPYKQTNCKWDSDVDINKLWIEFKRIRKDTTPIIFTCTTRFGYELITANPKEFKFDCVWAKSRKCGFLQARKRPLTNHEMVYFFYKKQPKYNYLKYHKYTKKEPSVKSDDLRKSKEMYNVGNNFSENKRGKYIPILPASVIQGDNGYGRNKEDVYGKIKDEFKTGGPRYTPALPASVIGDDKVYGEEKRPDDRRRDQIYDPALPATIQQFKSTKPSKHQTGKPVDLMEFLLKYWTDEGDTVFDPTFGGGSMPIACKKLNRQFIGCELDKKFYDEFMINIEKY